MAAGEACPTGAVLAAFIDPVPSKVPVVVVGKGGEKGVCIHGIWGRCPLFP